MSVKYMMSNHSNESLDYTEQDIGRSENYPKSTYAIVSKVAFLAGIRECIFDNPYEPPKREWFDQLKEDKNARIIRNLCMLRTQIESNYRDISEQMYYYIKNLSSLPHLISRDCLRELQQDGITIEKANCKLNQYIIDINRHISNHINNCRDLFPIWLKWEYLRAIFIMPNGLTENGIRSAASYYYLNRSKYPYQVYLNWPGEEEGNILFNDEKFLTLLYRFNRDHFEDLSKVRDASDASKNSIYDFLSGSEKTVIVVDCENSDPYKLYAALNNLDKAALLRKVSKIILYDDVHASSTWSILERFTEIPIQHEMIQRVKLDKSLVDTTLVAGTCREYYQNHVDSVVLVSSDSDYWGLIHSMPELRFLVWAEKYKCGQDIKRALEDANITYCYIDDFCTGNSNEIKVEAVLHEVQKRLDSIMQINIRDILKDAYRETYAEMTAGEAKQFFDKYIKTMRLMISESGALSVALGG